MERPNMDENLLNRICRLCGSPYRHHSLSKSACPNVKAFHETNRFRFGRGRKMRRKPAREDAPAQAMNL